MRKYRNLLLGLTIIIIGVASSYLTLINKSKKDRLLEDIRSSQFSSYQSPELPTYTYQGDLPSGALSEHKRMTERRVSDNISKKIEAKPQAKKKKMGAQKPFPQEKTPEVAAPVASPEKEQVIIRLPPFSVKPPFLTRLMSQVEAERVLGWGANIITIITGILLIFRRRKED